jgi:DNA topoisomerase-1
LTRSGFLSKMSLMKELSTVEIAKSVAKQAGLIYVSDQQPGLSRGKKLRDGFQYFDQHGKLLKNEKHLKRIRSLVIPPAWTSVWICPLENGHIQVTGKDARGRKQYRYHPSWQQARNENKFSKMLLFAKMLPKIRSQVKKDLRQDGLTKRRVIASVIEIMEQTMIRIGNAEYAASNESYGLTTILNRHAKVKGSTIQFKFKGKSSKLHDVTLEDANLAKIVRKCQELPGQELFGYIDDNGKVVDVTSQDVNDYLTEITGEHITAKDFRTWGGTVQAAVKLQSLGPYETKTALKKAIVSAVQHTSEQLRNTTSVCRKYYIHPCVLESYENGHLFKVHASCKKASKNIHRGLYQDEVFAVRLLESATKAGATNVKATRSRAAA